MHLSAISRTHGLHISEAADRSAGQESTIYPAIKYILSNYLYSYIYPSILETKIKLALGHLLLVSSPVGI